MGNLSTLISLLARSPFSVELHLKIPVDLNICRPYCPPPSFEKVWNEKWTDKLRLPIMGQKRCREIIQSAINQGKTKIIFCPLFWEEIVSAEKKFYFWDKFDNRIMMHCKTNWCNVHAASRVGLIFSKVTTLTASSRSRPIGKTWTS